MYDIMLEVITYHEEALINSDCAVWSYWSMGIREDERFQKYN